MQAIKEGDINVDTGLVSLVGLLTFGLFVFTCVSVTNYIGWKRRHDKAVMAKLEEIAERLGGARGDGSERPR